MPRRTRTKEIAGFMVLKEGIDIVREQKINRSDLLSERQKKSSCAHESLKTPRIDNMSTKVVK